MNALDVVAGVFLVLGAGFVMLAGVGSVRFTSTFARMHAAAKAPALGIAGIGIGVALTFRTWSALVTVLLIVVLQLIAGPVSAHLLGRSIYRQLEEPVDGIDELAATRKLPDDPS